MAGGDELSLVGGVGAAILFIGAGTNVYDAFSAVMSSPWSTEKFTSTEEDARKANKYVTHALAISGLYALAGAIIVYGSGHRTVAIFPILGAILAAAYMLKLYHTAIRDGMASNEGE
jgi:hypothetical protein